jgi:uncharacterized protein with PIN domain
MHGIDHPNDRGQVARATVPVIPDVPSETEEHHRCPFCACDRTARAEHVIVSDAVVVREEYRCTACGALFWVRANGAGQNTPRE